MDYKLFAGKEHVVFILCLELGRRVSLLPGSVPERDEALSKGLQST